MPNTAPTSFSPLAPQDRARFIAQVKRHEGTKRDSQGLHIAYRCTAGALTIGYGHNLDAIPVPGVSASTRLSEDQACRLLTADITAFEASLQKALPWCVELDPVRYATLLNMAFNMGIGVPGKSGLLSFTNTLASIKRGEYAEAAARMLQSKWATQVHYRAREMSEQMRTGLWAEAERKL